MRIVTAWFVYGGMALTYSLLLISCEGASVPSQRDFKTTNDDLYVAKILDAPPLS